MKTNTKWLCSLLLLLVVGAFPLVGCHRESTSTQDSDGTKATSASAIGIAECDDYVSKVHRCIDAHVPSAQKKSLEETLTRKGAAWKEMAANPGTRPALGDSCKLSLQTVKTSMQSYSCDW
jgi:hypothetical protein